MSQKDHQQDPPLSELEMLKQEHLAIRGCLPPGYEEAVKNTKCEQEKLREFHRCAANDPQPLSALCFSGGGIRSATFNLGVIQGLAKCNVLRRIDYLSTVSGGGYIGGWLSAWINRHDRGSTGVFEALGQKPAVQPLAQQQVASAAPAHAAAAALRVDANADCCAPAIDCPDATVEPAPVSHLREYSNYLTPRLGLFRADSAVVAATYLRNLLLNWIVFALSMIALAMIPRLYASLIGIFTIGTTTYWILFASALALMAMATANPLWALPSSREPNSAEEENRYATRDITWVRRWIICPLLLSSILLSYLKSWGSEPLDGGIRFAAWMSTYMLPPIAVALLRRRRMDWHCLVALVFAALCTGVCARLLNKHAIEPLLGQSLILYTIFAVPSSLLLYLLLLTFFVGFSSGRRGRDEDREWWARLQGCVLLFMIGWVAVMGVIVGGPYIIAALVERDQFTRISAAVIPIIASCIGLLGGYSGSTDAQDPRKRLLRDRIIEALPVTGARVALVMIFMFAAYGINAGFTRLNGVWLVHPEYYPVVDFTKSTMLAFGESPRWPLEMFAAFPMLYQIELAPVARQVAALNSVGCCISAGLLIYLAGWAINFNRFSLHAMYRDRLIRAYLGASKRTNRTPDPFTGFDPDDNIPMHHLRRGIITPEDIDDSDVMQLADLIVRAPSEKLRILREAANDTTDLDDPSRRHDELCKIWEPFRRLQQPVVEKAAQVAALIAVEEGKAHPASKPITADNPGDGAAGVAAKPLDRGPLKQAIIRLLNKVVRLPHLARDYETEVLSHEQRTRRRKARQSSGYDAGDPELQRALGALVDDGCPKILNRLILERILVNEANRALLKVDPRHTPPRPFHVVNLALNLVNTKNLAWQERKAASFVVTPLHCGFTKGYRRSEEYGGSISLGTAITISGAAASPNMGYHSSPSVTLLMTLFNVRLGWWLGNPAKTHYGNPNKATYRRRDPRWSVRPLIDEALGNTNDEYEYVYLSDGGHFDNLGLYEMVRRRCKFIIVSDASCDPECNFESLGNAMRKVQSDLAVTIDLRDIQFFPKQDKDSQQKNRYCAVGRINYGHGEDGILIYIKPALHELMPADVFNQSRSKSAFPHEPTSNQWFDESQFESYRRLGFEMVEHLFAGESPIPQAAQKEEPQNVHI